MDDNLRSTARYVGVDQYLTVDRISKLVNMSMCAVYIAPIFKESKVEIDGKAYYPASKVDEYLELKEQEMHFRFEITMFLEWVIKKTTWGDVANMLEINHPSQAIYASSGLLSYSRTLHVVKKLDFYLDEYVEQFLEEGGFLLVLEDVAKKIKVFQE